MAIKETIALAACAAASAAAAIFFAVRHIDGLLRRRKGRTATSGRRSLSQKRHG